RMGDQYERAGELPEPLDSYLDSYEEELVDERDGDLEAESEDLDGHLEPASDNLRQLWQPVYKTNQQSIERAYARLQSLESTRPRVSSVAGANHRAVSPVSTVEGTPPMDTIRTIKTIVPAPGEAPFHPSRRRSLAPSRLTTIAAVLATGILL